MPTLWEVTLGIVVGVSLVVVAGSAGIVAYHLRRRFVRDDPPGLWRERLRAYSEIMADVIRINRLAIELSEAEMFQYELEEYVMDNESEFDEPVADVTESLQRNYHLVDDEVAEVVNDYINYLSTHHAEGAHVGELLSLSSDVVSEMRQGVGLSSVFPEKGVEETKEDLEYDPEEVREILDDLGIDVEDLVEESK